jgi:hypothetical protein
MIKLIVQEGSYQVQLRKEKDAKSHRELLAASQLKTSLFLMGSFIGLAVAGGVSTSPK